MHYSTYDIFVSRSWTRLSLYQHFTIHINPGHGFICINTLLSISILDTALSVSILYYPYQSWPQLYLYQYFTIHINPGHSFICINTLLSISILDTALSVSILYYPYQSWTRLYLYQYFTIHINPGNGFICISSKLIYFIKIDSKAFSRKPRSNYSALHLKAEYFPTECILGYRLEFKFNRRNY